jgi:TonB family protein
LDASEGGIALVLAGELQPEETVGVSFQLPLAMEPVEARAVVRHYGPIRCGLQFLAMPPEQQVALQTWIGRSLQGPDIPAAEAHVGKDLDQLDQATTLSDLLPKARRGGFRRHRRWLFWPAAVSIVLIVAIASWWHNGLSDVERNARTPSTGDVRPLAYVPGTVMEQRLLHKVEPVYPPEAEVSKLQGLVVVQAAIGADGTVREVHPISGPAVLGRAAAEAVRWWRFQPYQVEGQPVAVQTTIEVEFRLSR